MNVNGSFGDWLRARRKALDLTQADLADQVGCSTMTIRKIEAGERRPSRQISERMADVLAIALEEQAAFVSFARQLPTPESALLDELSALNLTSNLPPQTTPFIGREQELIQIAERLDDPACRLLTLLGPGGIGKTRLAVQAAADQVGKYADGVYFVSLTPVGAATFIAPAIASALQLSLYGEDDPGAQIISYLRSRHMLLVMDNYEHLLAGIDLLDDLLANAPRLRIMMTSRERLNMQEEWALPVEGLPYPDQMNGDISRYSAVQLFVQTARRVQPGFSLDGNQTAVIDICRAVEGMPLGIELAATWLRAMPCTQIAGQIRHDLDFLVTPLRNVAERHRSLRAVFEHSWGLLAQDERDALKKLSVFRGGIDPEAASQVAGASLPLLAGLVDKSLVRLNPAGRCELHELLRQFAADKLSESGLVDETRQRHLRCFLQLAEALEPHMFGPQQIAAWDRLDAELDNIMAALAYAAQNNDAESGLRLASALGWFWNRRNHLSEGRKWLTDFLTAGHDLSASVRAKAMHHLLELTYELNDYQSTTNLCLQAVALADELQDQHLRAWLLCSVGWISNTRSHLEESLMLFSQLHEYPGVCETYIRMATLLLGKENPARVRELLDEGIRLARSIGEKSILAWLLMISAYTNWHEGILDERTTSLCNESLALFHALRNRNGTAAVLHLLGRIAYDRGEDDHARIFFSRCLRLGRRNFSKQYGVLCLIYLAEYLCCHDEPTPGTRILGALSEPVRLIFPGCSLFENDCHKDYERALAAAHARLDEATFAAAFTAGQMMSLDEAAAFALADYAPVEAVAAQQVEG